MRFLCFDNGIVVKQMPAGFLNNEYVLAPSPFVDEHGIYILQYVFSAAVKFLQIESEDFEKMIVKMLELNDKKQHVELKRGVFGDTFTPWDTVLALDPLAPALGPFTAKLLFPASLPQRLCSQPTDRTVMNPVDEEYIERIQLSYHIADGVATPVSITFFDEWYNCRVTTPVEKREKDGIVFLRVQKNTFEKTLHASSAAAQVELGWPEAKEDVMWAPVVRGSV